MHRRPVVSADDNHLVARVPSVTQAASSTTASGLRVHVAERTDVLVGALADVLATTPSDPFTPDVVAVPTRGVERWVAQRLSHRLGTAQGADGICANVLFPSPRRLVSDVLATTTDEDPWSPDQLAWHVLATIDAHHGADWLATVSRYLGDDHDEVRRGRRFRLAQRVARLFGSYDVQRSAMLRAWADGLDEDGLGAPLPEDLRWQPRLWRAVRDAVDVPAPGSSGSTKRWRGCDGTRRASTCRRGCRSSVRLRSPTVTSGCSTRSPSTARSTCGCRSRRSRSGAG